MELTHLADESRGVIWIYRRDFKIAFCLKFSFKLCIQQQSCQPTEALPGDAGKRLVSLDKVLNSVMH